MTTTFVETAAFADIEFNVGTMVIDGQYIPHGPVVDEILTRLNKPQIQVIKDLIGGESGLEFTNITLDIDGGLTVSIRLHRVPLAQIRNVDHQTHGTFITFAIGASILRDQMQESYGVTIEGKVHRATRLVTYSNPRNIVGTETIGLAMVLPRFYGYQADYWQVAGDTNEIALTAIPDLHYQRRAKPAYVCDELAA